MKLQLTLILTFGVLIHSFAQSTTTQNFTKIDTIRFKPGWAKIEESKEIRSERKSAPEFKINSPQVKSAGTGAKRESTQEAQKNTTATSNFSSATIDAGRTVSSIDVSATGGSVFNVPFTLPPGIANAVPQIGLSYNSQVGNGIAGYGWNVSGLSAITRIPATVYHDNLISGINYNQNDRFALDGQRLLLKSGTYGGDGAEYQTENYSNVRIISHGVSPYGADYGPNNFEVLYPDGSKALYGYDNYSKTPTDYAISYSENPLGARINYNYSIVENVLYPYGIGYGGIGENGLNINNIYFSYKSASRSEHAFIGGLSAYRSLVLDKIKVVANGTFYRTYQLSHDFVTTLNYQRLTGLQELTGDETKAFEPITFSYETTGDVISSHTISNLSLSGIAANNSQVVTADFTGNGTMDFLLYPNAKNKFWAFYDLEPGSPYMQLGYEINTGPFREIFPATELTHNNKILAGQGMALVKDNGYNGLKFSVYSSGTVAPVYYQYEKEWNDIPLGQGYYSACDDQYHDGSPVNFDFVSGDFNGDGMTDVISIGKSGSVIVYEYMDDTGNPWENQRSTADGFRPPIGIGNCVQQYGESGSPVHFINLDRRLTTDFVINLGQIYPYYQSGDKIYAADANGDGKTDLILVKSGVMTVYTLNKNNYLEYLWQTNDSRITNSQPSVLGDFNGDGKIDLMFSTGNNNLYAFFMSTGKGFFKHEGYQPFANVAGTWDGTPGVERLQLHYIIANDVNGDGKADIISAQSTTRNYNSYGVIDVTVHHNLGNSYTSAPSFSSGTGSSTYTNLRHYPMPIFLNPSRPNNNLEFGFMSDNSVSLFKFGKDLKKESQVAYVSQDGIFHHIEYKNLRADTYNEDITLYQSDYEQTYPYVNLHDIPGLNVVSKVTRYFGFEQVSQVFGYGNAVSHAEGLGFLGFSELVRSSWHTGNSDVNRTFNISIQNPQLHGANVRNFSAKSPYLNPYIKNFALTSTPASGVADGASINDYISRTDQIYNTQLQPNKVFVNIPNATVSKDMLTNTFSNRVIEYDAYQNPTKVTTNVNGNSTNTIDLTYDNSPSADYIGRLLSKKLTANSGSDVFSSQEEYTYTGFLPTEIKYKGHNTPYLIENLTYDAFGNVTQKTTNAPGGSQRTTSTQYDPTGRFPIVETDANALQTSFLRDDASGNMLSKTNPFGQIETFVYDDWGRQRTITENSNANTYRSYQKNGTNIEITETDDEGRYKLSVFDASGRYIENREKNVLGQIIGKAWHYDVYGRQIEESELGQPGNYTQWNTTAYDEYGRPKQIVSFTGRMTNISYSGLSTTVNDGVKSTTTTKNAQGEVIALQDPGGNISYQYFANSKLKTIDYAGSVVNIEQDGWGRRTKLTDPTAGVFTFEYNGFGQLTKQTSPKGTTQYTYDAAGSVLQKSIVGDETNMQYAYTYDPGTKLVTGVILMNADGNYTNYTYNYDSQKRLTGRVEDNLHATFVRNFSYSNNGRISTETYIATNKLNNITTQKTIEFQYQNGELLQKTMQGSGQILWKINSLDNNGRLGTALQGNNLKTTFTYDSYGLPQQNTVQKISGSVQALMNLTYNFDAQQGVLNSRTNSAVGWSENFSYDNLNRLTAFNDNSSNNTQSYDSRGRISNNSQLGDYQYDSDSYKQSELNNLNGGANGYYQSRSLQQITYNAFKSPVEIVEPGFDRVSFQYNGSLGRAHMYYGNEQADKMSRRYRRHYSDDGFMEITDDLQTGITSFAFYLGGDAYSAPALWKEVHNGAVTTSDLYYLHRDHLGSIVLISNDQGDVVEKRQFDAWGNLAKLTDGADNPLSAFIVTDRGYTGHEHLLGVGLIHMNARLYDPKLHRFLSPDNFIIDPYNTQNFNRFGYGLNNPLIFTDNSGEIFWLVPVLIFVAKAALVGAAIGAVTYTASVGLSNGGFNNWSWGQFGKSVGFGAISGVVTAGIGSAFGHSIGTFGHELLRGLAHGVANGGISELSGGNFLSSFAAGTFSSYIGSGFKAWGGDFAESAVGGISVGALSGGIGAELTGGDFWKGATIGATVAALNHYGQKLLSGGEDGDDDKKKRTEGKGNKFRGGKKDQRDADMKKYPKDFKDWYHKNAKDYKLPGQPDPDLAEPYNDWLELGKPNSFSQSIKTDNSYNWNSIRNEVQTITGLTGGALTLYLIISEGSRLFPPRNLIPIP